MHPAAVSGWTSRRGADLAAALQGLEQQDAYPRSLYAVGVTGSAEDETIAQSAAGAMVQSLSAHEARDGASSGVESLCGNRMRFTFRCKLRVPEDNAAACGVTPDAAGEAELTRSCVLVRDAVGFWHPAAVGKCIRKSPAIARNSMGSRDFFTFLLLSVC